MIGSSSAFAVITLGHKFYVVLQVIVLEYCILWVFKISVLICVSSGKGKVGSNSGHCGGDYSGLPLGHGGLKLLE